MSINFTNINSFVERHIGRLRLNNNTCSMHWVYSTRRIDGSSDSKFNQNTSVLESTDGVSEEHALRNSKPLRRKPDFRQPYWSGLLPKLIRLHQFYVTLLENPAWYTLYTVPT